MPEVVENLSTINTKIKQSRRPKLAIWDVDDTLFRTPKNMMKIYVLDRVTHKPIIKNGKPLFMTPGEFADEKARDALLDKVKGALEEPGSFLDFRNAEIFRKHAVAITENLEYAVKDFKDPRTFFMVLTARGNMDNKSLFLEHFKDHKLNMNTNHSHIVRAASTSMRVGSEAKKEIVDMILKENPTIKHVTMWDDSADNIGKFNSLKTKHPGDLFESHLIPKE